MLYRTLFLLVFLSLAIPAKAGFEDAPWKAQVERTYAVGGQVYTDSFLVWTDYGAIDGATNTRMSWDVTQMNARRICAICTSSRFWGRQEEAKAWTARQSGEKFNFRPLASHVFLIVNIRAHGPMPATQRPAWRKRPEDVVEVTLHDGRRLTSYGPLEVNARQASLVLPSSLAEEMCLQNKGMLEGQILYTPSELDQLWKSSQRPPPRDTEDRLNWEFLRVMYGRRAQELVFLVPFDTNDNPFKPRDIAGIRLHLLDAWVDLQPQVGLVQRSVP